MKNIINNGRLLLPVILVLVLSSCEYEEIGSANYSEQKIYMPTASAASVAPDKIYSINTLATPGLTYRYVVNTAENKFDIPLGVYRSGAILDGAVDVNIQILTDTVTKLINEDVLVDTELLPTSEFSIDNLVSVESGRTFSPFTLSVDLDFLLANLGKKFAIAVKVSSTQVASLETYSTTIILIDPAFLIPVADFTSIIEGSMVSFTNTSSNAASYSWNFGDGSPAVTTTSASHTYSSPGTYNVTLTAFGALGDLNESVVTKEVIIP